MLEPKLVTSSTTAHTEAQLDILAEAGFTHICYCVTNVVKDWSKQKETIHARGMKLAAVLPDWDSLPLTDASAFRTYHRPGPRNAVSYWDMETEKWALNDPLTVSAVSHVDAVIVAPKAGDMPYPVDWSHVHYDDFGHSCHFWCWDTKASAAWQKYQAGLCHPISLPVQPEFDIRGHSSTDPYFYKWYQDAWMNRIRRLSQWALGFGIKDVWMWMVPFNKWTAENMTNATADSFLLLDDWATEVKDAGAHPCFVVACLWSIWPGWKSGCIEDVESFIQQAGHDVIAGAELGQLPEAFVTNLKALQPYGRKLGMVGFFGTDLHIINSTGLQRDAMIKAVRDERYRWEIYLREREESR